MPLNLLLCAISFSGSIAGIGLAFITPEELQPYRRYLVAFAALLFSLSVTLPLVGMQISFLITIPAFLVLLGLSYRYNGYLRYVYFLLALSMMMTTGFNKVVAALLVFGLGFPLGSLDMLPHVSGSKLEFRIGIVMKSLWPYTLILIMGLLDLVFF
jgi:hypothetical protein